MDFYLLLFVTYMTYVIMGFKKLRLSIISPTMITILSLTIVIGLGYWYRKEMGTELYFYTYLVMALGGGAILGTGYGIQEWAKLKWGEGNFDDSLSNDKYFLVSTISPFKLYKYSSIFMIIFILFSLFCVFINTSGDTDVSRMSQYREFILHPHLYPDNIQLVFIVSQFYKIALAITYISAYVAIYNGVILNKPIFKGTGIITTIILFCIGSSISMGARQPSIEVFIFMLLTYLFFMLKEKRFYEVRKFLYKLSPIVVFSPFLYILYGVLVGRQDGNNVTLGRIAELLAGGIYALNIHIWEPARTSFWGQSSFADIYDKFINIGLLPQSARMAYHEFDKFGNTLSLYGRWYEDFGVIGVIIMSILVISVFSFGYEYLRRQSNKYIKNHVWNAIFLTELISLVWAGYDDRIRALLAFSQMVIISLIGVLLYLGYRVKLKKS